MFYEVRVSTLEMNGKREIPCKEVEAIKKKKKTGILEKENIRTKIKESLEEASRIGITDKPMNFKTNKQEISSLSVKRKEKKPQRLWNNIKTSSIHITGVQEEKRKI